MPKEWIAKYKGKFDQGWDKLREETLARQIKLGVVPAGTKLAPKPEAIKDWDTLSADEKKLFARQMEVFAGFGEYADYEIGRLIQAIEDLGQLDNTLVFYIVGDNGASAEGGMNGLFNEMTYFNGVPETVAGHPQALRRPGRPELLSATTPPAGPWRATRRSPGRSRSPRSYGGTRNGMVVHWPKGIKAKGEVRSQWHHVIDIAPTILEAAGLPEPKIVNGTPQTPIEGVSMVYTFDDAKAKDRHKTQYFEIFGNRGIYHDGWLAGTVHRAAWECKPRQPFLEDKWELYHVDEDFSLANDLAAKNPDEAQGAAGPLPEGSGQVPRAAARRSLARAHQRRPRRPARPDGRPHLADGLRGHDRDDGERLHQHQEPVAHDHRRGGDPEGRRQRRDPRPGRPLRRLEPVREGWQADVHLQLPRPEALHGRRHRSRCPPGKATIRFEFAYDGGGLGKGGTGTIFVNGEKVAEGTDRADARPTSSRRTRAPTSAWTARRR